MPGMWGRASRTSNGDCHVNHPGSLVDSIRSAQPNMLFRLQKGPSFGPKRVDAQH